MSPPRPAVRSMFFLLGLVLTILLLRAATRAGASTDRDFVRSQEFGIWLLVASASVLVWVAVLLRGCSLIRRLVTGAEEEERPGVTDWAVQVAGVVVVAVAVVVVLGIFERGPSRVPVEHWTAVSRALLAVAGAAAAPWMVAVWMTHERLREAQSRIRSFSAPGEDVDAEIRRLLGHWQFIERAAMSFLGIVLTATLMTGALRVALVPEEVEESAFPASDVLLYGAFFAFLIAVVMLPLVASWRSKATLLLDEVFPVSSTMTDEQAARRQRLTAAFNLDASMFRSPLTVLGILSPLLTGVLTVFLPQLAT